MKNLLGDIRFWIIVFFVIRLFGITNPPLEVGHNWRQTTVTMVARNFLEVDNSIFYPRLDIAGEKTGITGMEFPLLNYLIYLCAKLFGYQHWYGRLINLIISSFGLWFFYKLVNKYFTNKHAFYATIILAVSVWFQYSRKIMPDTFAMSLILACIYFGSNYLDNKSPINHFLSLLCYFSLLALGVLSKLPSGYLLIVFVLFYFDPNVSFKRKIIFAFTTLFGLFPALLWYFYWVPNLVEKFGFWHFFMGKSIQLGITEIFNNLNAALNRFYFTALKFIGFVIFLYGFVISFIKKERSIYTLFILTFSCFLIIVFKGGDTFSNHGYYIVPFVPVMALVAGYGLTNIENSKIAVFILVAVSIEGLANQKEDFRIKERDMRIINLENDLDKVSLREDLILINSGEYPTPMYFSHRRGWIESNEKIEDEKFIGELKHKGLKYIVILKRSFGSEIAVQQYTRVFENEDYCIYKL